MEKVELCRGLGVGKSRDGRSQESEVRDLD